MPGFLAEPAFVKFVCLTIVISAVIVGIIAGFRNGDD